MRNRFTVFILAVLVLAAPVVAEEPEQPEQAAGESEQKIEERRDEIPKQEEFDPTEEIEEDYSVPFPVDI